MTARWTRIAVVVVLGLLAAELGVRLAGDRFPEALVWPSVESQVKVGQIDALAADGGAPVVFVGSSVVNAGLDPAVAGPALGTTVYNAGLSAALPALAEPWITNVVLPRLRPRLVVYGVTSADFADDGTGGFFQNALEDSPAGAALLGTEGVQDRLERWVGEVSALWRIRSSLRDPTVLWGAVSGDPVRLEPEFGPVAPDGAVAYRTDAPAFDFEDPVIGLPVERWELGTSSDDLIRDTIRAVQAVGATVVLVDMPVTDEYIELHPGGAADYDRYLAALRGLAAETGATLLEYDTLRDHALFADLVHLGRPGAATLTERLAADLVSRGLVPPG